jgi:hypothetical protein
VQDSHTLDGLLNKSNPFTDGYANSAYRSAEIEAKLKARGFKSPIHRRATRNHPLSEAKEDTNRRRSKIRARIELVFGAQETAPGQPDRAHDRHRAGESRDLLAEPPPSTVDPGTHRRRMKGAPARSPPRGARAGTGVMRQVGTKHRKRRARRQPYHSSMCLQACIHAYHSIQAIGAKDGANTAVTLWKSPGVKLIPGDFLAQQGGRAQLERRIWPHRAGSANSSGERVARTNC